MISALGHLEIETSLMYRRIPFWFAVLLSGGVVVANAMVFPLVPVIEDCSAESMWEATTGVDLGANSRGTASWWIGFDDSNCYYRTGGYHRSYVLRVTRKAFESRIPEFIEKSRSAVGSDSAIKKFLPDLLIHYDADQSTDAVERFDAAYRRSFITYLADRKHDLPMRIGEEVGMEWMRINAAQYLWYQAFFELIWLVFLVWFFFWPSIWRLPRWRSGLHGALIPLLFMLPVYLGYQKLMSTSIGPTGGGYYTWLAMHVPTQPQWDWDSWMISHAPDLLGGLSHHPGSVMVSTGRGLCGPTMCLIVGLALGAVMVWVASHRDAGRRS